MTLPEFCLIVRGSGREAMQGHVSKETVLITLSICCLHLPWLIPGRSKSLSGVCQETLSNSAASAYIHHWRQKMGKLTNRISRNIWDWVTNPPACPENLRPSDPVPILQIGKSDSFDKPPRGRSPTRCPSPPWQMGTVGTPGLPGPTAEAEGEPCVDSFLLTSFWFPLAVGKLLHWKHISAHPVRRAVFQGLWLGLGFCLCFHEKTSMRGSILAVISSSLILLQASGMSPTRWS